MEILLLLTLIFGLVQIKCGKYCSHINCIFGVADCLFLGLLLEEYDGLLYEGDDMSVRFYLKACFQGKSRTHNIKC